MGLFREVPMSFFREAKHLYKALFGPMEAPEDPEPVYTEPDKVTVFGDVTLVPRCPTTPFVVKVRVNVYESKEQEQGDEFSIVLRDPNSGETLATLFLIPSEKERLRWLLARPLTAP
jgi:hypothetical protein